MVQTFYIALNPAICYACFFLLFVLYLFVFFFGYFLSAVSLTHMLGEWTNRYTVPPSIKAVNQLVGAPVEREVTLECIVEVYPKPLNGWYRNEGK